MKNAWEEEYEIPSHIDLKKGSWVRNPLIQKFQELNLISLDADVKEVFSDSQAVNDALRALILERTRKDMEAQPNGSVAA